MPRVIQSELPSQDLNPGLTPNPTFLTMRPSPPWAGTVDTMENNTSSSLANLVLRDWPRGLGQSGAQGPGFKSQPCSLPAV